MGPFLHADSFPSVPILEPLQVRRNDHDRESGRCGSYSVHTSLPDIRHGIGRYRGMYLHLAIMFAGGYVLGRELGLRSIACVTLAGMFASSSWLSLHVSAGHLNFLSIAYMPWVLALLLASWRSKRWFPSLLQN